MIKSKENYFKLLDFLGSFCNQVRIIEDEDSKFLSSIRKYYTEKNWTRKFPGHSGGKRFKVLYYNVTEELMQNFMKYNCFFEVDGEDTNLDIAFYRYDNLVCWIVSHEELCVLEERYVKQFHDYLNSSNIAVGID